MPHGGKLFLVMAAKFARIRTEDMSAHIPRFMEHLVAERLGEFPVVMIEGLRQAGKTTLVRRFEGSDRVGRYYSCDDSGILDGIAAAGDDFIRDLGDRVVIDEVQEWPRCMNAIKREVDERPAPDSVNYTIKED